MADSPFRIQPVPGGFEFRFDVDAERLEGQRKVARFDRFEMFCDESAAIGGGDTAPPPLAYFASALAF